MADFHLGDRVITTREIAPPNNGNGPRSPIPAGTFGTVVGMTRAAMGPLIQVNFGFTVKLVSPHVLEVVEPGDGLPLDGEPLTLPEMVELIVALIQENAALKSALILGQNSNGHRAN